MAAASSARFVLTPHDPFLFGDYPLRLRKRLSTGFLLRSADAVIALSDRERVALLTRYGLRDDQITVIPNGVDPSVFRRPERITPDAEHILYVGQLQTFKGLDFLFSAMPEILRAHPGVNLTLAYHNDAELARYRGLAAELGIESHVIFGGPKTPEELAVLYASAAAFVQPSLAEALSGVVLEAMSCGAPIVATDVGGIRTQLDNETGIIVPPRDPQAIAKAVCRLLDCPELRGRLGSAALAKAARKFTLSNMVESHLRLYEAVLRKKRIRSRTRTAMLGAVGRIYLGRQRTEA
jgi:glycosyltransferase involved in cell wall biosynthesis